MAERPVLLLHGLGVDHRMWGPTLPFLQEKGQLLVPDLPGFGCEPPLPVELCSPTDYADWLARWLLERRVGALAVAGYSMGGTLAMLLALRHPELVERLVLCCTSACWGRGARRWMGRAFAGVGGISAMELFQLSVRWSCTRHIVTESDRSQIVDMVARAHRPSMRRLYMELVELSLVPQLARLDCPVLVVAGRRDWLAPPAHQRLLCRSLPHARLEIVPGAGHFLCLSHPERFAELLLRGLRGEVSVVPGTD